MTKEHFVARRSVNLHILVLNKISGGGLRLNLMLAMNLEITPFVTVDR